MCGEGPVIWTMSIPSGTNALIGRRFPSIVAAAVCSGSCTVSFVWDWGGPASSACRALLVPVFRPSRMALCASRTCRRFGRPAIMNYLRQRGDRPFRREWGTASFRETDTRRVYPPLSQLTRRRRRPPSTHQCAGPVSSFHYPEASSGRESTSAFTCLSVPSRSASAKRRKTGVMRDWIRDGAGT